VARTRAGRIDPRLTAATIAVFGLRTGAKARCPGSLKRSGTASWLERQPSRGAARCRRQQQVLARPQRVRAGDRPRARKNQDMLGTGYTLHLGRHGMIGPGPALEPAGKLPARYGIAAQPRRAFLGGHQRPERRGTVRRRRRAALAERIPCLCWRRAATRAMSSAEATVRKSPPADTRRRASPQPRYVERCCRSRRRSWCWRSRHGACSRIG
jgi:hypothetical protein